MPRSACYDYKFEIGSGTPTSMTDRVELLSVQSFDASCKNNVGQA